MTFHEIRLILKIIFDFLLPEVSEGSDRVDEQRLSFSEEEDKFVYRSTLMIDRWLMMTCSFRCDQSIGIS